MEDRIYKKSSGDVTYVLKGGLEKFDECYEILKSLGKGAFGQVYEAFDLKKGERVAVKVDKIHPQIIKKDQNVNIMKLRQEAEILKSLKHPNIVQFKHFRECEDCVCIGMELLEGGHLKRLIAQRVRQKKQLTDLEVSTIFKGIMSAVQYIHEKNIVHRDLKPENILFEKKGDYGSVKIADFGLSAKYHHIGLWRLDKHCGTKVFMAPEIIFKADYSKSVDIWASGIIMYMLLSNGKHPFYEKSDTNESYEEKLKNPNWRFPSSFSELARNLFYRLMKVEPVERYNASQALAHPWVCRDKEA